MEFRFKGSFSSDQFIQSNSNRPHVYSLVISSAVEHFRGTIVRSSSDGEHFSFVASFNEFLANPEVNEFDFFFLAVIKNILWFYVPVANVMRMDVGHSGDQLVHYYFEVLFWDKFAFKQIGHFQIVHNEVAGVLAQVQVHGSVLDYVGMVKGSDYFKIFLQEQDMFFIHFHRLNCKHFLAVLIFLKTFPHNPIGSFPNLLSHPILLIEFLHADLCEIFFLLLSRLRFGHIFSNLQTLLSLSPFFNFAFNSDCILLKDGVSFERSSNIIKSVFSFANFFTYHFIILQITKMNL